MGPVFSSNRVTYSAAENDGVSCCWSVRGKNVLITGASGGIGAELARQFAARGAAGLALLARSHDQLQAVAQNCRQLAAADYADSNNNGNNNPFQAESFVCDLTDETQIQNAIAAVTEAFDQQRFDVVVLNAGRSQGCYFEEIQDVSDINYLLKLNINGVITTLHHLLPLLPKNSASRIVIMSSVAGCIPVPYRTIYCASKHALAGFANSLRIELVDTYGDDAPAVQLINFPEVHGTNLNTGRLTFGADRPPAEFISNERQEGSAAATHLLTVERACKELMPHIAAGSREWGQPLKVRLLQPLYGFIPSILDKLILQTVRKTHRRPEDSEAKAKAKEKTR